MIEVLIVIAAVCIAFIIGYKLVKSYLDFKKEQDILSKLDHW